MKLESVSHSLRILTSIQSSFVISNVKPIEKYLPAPLRRDAKIEKFNTRKANEHAPYVYEFQIYRMTPKNIPQNLVRLYL
jgi:hypothetical protein